MKDKFLIVIAGPTAVGKTKIAIELAKYFNTVILSADSRQIYKELKIGTARPTEDELKQAKHFFIANKSIFEYYNASKYEQEAIELLKNLYEKYDKIILAGGSGLYINALLYGIDDLPEINLSLRKQLISEYENFGLQHIRDRLKKLDPEYYNKVDLNNPKRILKALEVSIQTGKPYSSFLTGTPKKRFFKTIKIALNLPREQLYSKINKRVDLMIEQGLIKEAYELYPHRELTPLKTVGYRELFDFFEGKISKNKAIEKIKSNTRAYARKQISWFKRDNYNWFSPEQLSEIIKFIEKETGKKT